MGGNEHRTELTFNVGQSIGPATQRPYENRNEAPRSYHCPMPTRECDWCGRTYTYTRGHSRFDTDACRVAYYRNESRNGPPYTMICESCGVEFKAIRKDTRFHNATCRSQAHRNR